MASVGFAVGVLFFVPLAVAALTSMVGILEPITAWLERRSGRGRAACAVAATAAVALVSLPAVLAHNLWADWRMFDVGLLTVYDYLPYDVLLPLGGLLIAVFAGWRVAADTARGELASASPWLFRTWRLPLRYVAVPAVLVIFVFGLFG